MDSDNYGTSPWFGASVASQPNADVDAIRCLVASAVLRISKAVRIVRPIVLMDALSLTSRLAAAVASAQTYGFMRSSWSIRVSELIAGLVAPNGPSNSRSMWFGRAPAAA